MNTHVHHSLLPPSVAHSPGCKIVYVCREPEDMLVSLWHFYKSSATTDGSTYTFSDLFENACEGKHSNGPIWDHILGYWQASQVTPERILFLRYEEMLRDPVGSVRELAQFLGVPFTGTEEAAELPEEIVKLCSIETLRGVSANKMVADGIFVKFPRTSFFRKGVAGDWVNHMTPEMAQRFDAIVEEKLHGSGLSFKS
uniref:Sulfotransferase n=1 Tax=Aegilops tauschii subsp. strangulata TaxID=200361 RepID=A0A453AK56_AEGTS